MNTPLPINSPGYRTRLNGLGRAMAFRDDLPRLGQPETYANEGDKGADGEDGATGPPGPPGPPGSKYAMVPGLQNPVALFCMEGPSPWFMDVMAGTTDSVMVIDPEFVEVCEPGTLMVVSAVPEECTPVGVRLDGAFIFLTSPVVTKVNVVVMGVRRGSYGLRFPAVTVDQMVKNNNAWDSFSS